MSRLIKEVHYFISDDKEHDTLYVQHCFMLLWEHMKQLGYFPFQHIVKSMVLCGSIPIFDFLHSPTFKLLIDLELFCFRPWERGSGCCRSIMQARNPQGTSEARWIKASECSWGGVILEGTGKETSCFTYQKLWRRFIGNLKLVTSTSLVIIVVTQSRAAEACIKWDQC